MPRTQKLVQQAGIRLGRCLSEVLPFVVYIREVQLVAFSRDIRKVELQTMISWGLPARLAVEVKRLADLYYFESSVLKLAKIWRRKLKPRLLTMKSDNFEWDVASSDFSVDDFKLVDDEEEHRKANEKIREILQQHVHKWRLRRTSRIDKESEVAVKLRQIAKVLHVDGESSHSWFILLVKRHWLRTIEDVHHIPDHVWQRWSSAGLPWRVAIALRCFDSTSFSREIPMLPVASPWRSPRKTNQVGKASSASLETRPGVSSSSVAEDEPQNEPALNAVPSPPSLVNSLVTLQSKLIEFSKDRLKPKVADNTTEDAELTAFKFKVKMQISINGTWSELFTFRLVQSSRLKWALAWWSVGREHQSAAGHVAVLSIAKVARTEALIFVIKYRSSSKVEEMYLKCQSEDDQMATAKLLRRLIRETREKMKTVILGN